MTTRTMPDEGSVEALEIDDVDPLVGTKIGPHTIEDKLGEGAMCTVYRARNEETQSTVAIKLLQPARAKQRIYAQRLRREASVSMRLAHPNLVKVLECGTSPEVGPYLVMELLEGRTLQCELASERPMSLSRIAKILRKTAAGLSAAHRAGYIHRDLKPANLMLLDTPEGEDVKILDFGIVGMVSSNAYETQLTDDNLILGTPSYMAPEQFEHAGVTPAADLYALGAILYHALARRPPFLGSIKEVIAQHLVAPPDQLPDHGGLGPLAHWLLEKSPAQRPRSAEHVIELLDQLIPELERRDQAIELKRIRDSQPSIEALFVPRVVENSDVIMFHRTRSPLSLRVALPAAVTIAVLAGALAAHAMLEANQARRSAPITSAIEADAQPARKLAQRTPPPPPPETPLELTSFARDARLPIPGEPAAGPASEAAIEATIEPVDTASPPSARAKPRATQAASDLLALRRKLQRVSNALSLAAGKIPTAELNNFEERYLDLSSALRPGLAQKTYDSLGARIDGLHAQIASARDVGP